MSAELWRMLRDEDLDPNVNALILESGTGEIPIVVVPAKPDRGAIARIKALWKRQAVLWLPAIQAAIEAVRRSGWAEPIAAATAVAVTATAMATVRVTVLPDQARPPLTHAVQQASRPPLSRSATARPSAQPTVRAVAAHSPSPAPAGKPTATASPSPSPTHTRSPSPSPTITGSNTGSDPPRSPDPSPAPTRRHGPGNHGPKPHPHPTRADGPGKQPEASPPPVEGPTVEDSPTT